MRLANKVAIITGGSAGLGRATAYLFAKEGAKVVVVADRNDAGGRETVAVIQADGGEAVYVHADVSRAADVQHLVEETLQHFGRIDVLFNNAAIAIDRSPVEDIDESLWDRMYDVNVKGIWLGVKYVVPEMRKTGGGVIINTGSMSGVRPRGKDAAYASAKGAVNALTKELALELGPDIRVNCINPGPIFTPMTGGDFAPTMAADIQELPLKRGGRPEDIAYAALFLASDESAFITGLAVNVDGGRSI